mgnify:CR=1 FL=1
MTYSTHLFRHWRGVIGHNIHHLRVKRRLAAWDDDYLASLLTA